jgi:hypothetical protein
MKDGFSEIILIFILIFIMIEVGSWIVERLLEFIFIGT